MASAGGDRGGFSPMAFLDDFEQVEALLVGCGSQSRRE
jgi:hypothetical protein